MVSLVRKPEGRGTGSADAHADGDGPSASTDFRAMLTAHCVEAIAPLMKENETVVENLLRSARGHQNRERQFQLIDLSSKIGRAGYRMY